MSTYSTPLRQSSVTIKGLSVKQKLEDSLIEQSVCLEVSCIPVQKHTGLLAKVVTKG